MEPEHVKLRWGRLLQNIVTHRSVPRRPIPANATFATEVWRLHRLDYDRGDIGSKSGGGEIGGGLHVGAERCNGADDRQKLTVDQPR